VDWIHLAQDRVCWRVVVNAVMNLRVMAPPNLLVILNSNKCASVVQLYFPYLIA
jgi:hypothetical protein